MYLVDANILVYAADPGAPSGQAARDWLDEQLAAPQQYVGLPWPSLLAFLRLVTNPRIYSPPASVRDAWEQIEDWLDRPAAWVPGPGPRHRGIMSDLIRAVHPAGNLIPDAHLAAVALEHGLTVVSADTDFAKFPGLKWVNPVHPGDL